MLDSLVRVSRRVGGATNLLTTEMQNMSNMLAHLPVGFKTKNILLDNFIINCSVLRIVKDLYNKRHGA